MKKLRFIPVVLASIIFTSCEKTESSCSKYNLDFTYSLSYSTFNFSAEVCYSNVSNGLPKGTDIEWIVNGSDSEYSQCATFRDNGKYSISMTATTPDGIQCSTYKEFEIDKIDNGF